MILHASMFQTIITVINKALRPVIQFFMRLQKEQQIEKTNKKFN